MATAMQMDFFGSQDRARNRTRGLVFLYALAMLLIITAIYGLVSLLGFGGAIQGALTDEPVSPSGPIWRLDVLFVVAAATVLLIGGATLYKIKALGSGGGTVAASLGGREVTPGTRDPDERRLLNVVEEMSIASGTPMPAVFVLEGEDTINAFAAGYHLEDAAVAVTRGAIRKLTRDELQGVIAHEFSHILGGDMRLNIRLIGPIFGLVCLAFFGRMILYSGGRRRSSSDSKGQGAIVLLGLGLMLIGWIGVLFGRLIQSAISRQREYLADASAVQFTRNPAGIAGALRRIGYRETGSKISHQHAEDTAHLFFAQALQSAFSTHPPLPKRIKAIDPQWDGAYLPPRKEAEPETAESTDDEQGPVDRRFRNLAGAAAAVGMAGSLSQSAIRTAIGERAAIHRDFGEDLASPKGAAALLAALILSDRAEAREAQLAKVEAKPGAPSADEIRVAYGKVEGKGPQRRFSLAELAVPAFRRMSPAERQGAIDTLTTLASADDQIDLREFLILKTIEKQASPNRRSSRGRLVNRANERGNDISMVLSFVARVDADDAAEAGELFRNALADRPHLQPHATFIDRDLTPGDLAGPLERLTGLSFALRREILAAAAAIVLGDGETSEREWTTVRLIALALECPMPPMAPA